MMLFWLTNVSYRIIFKRLQKSFLELLSCLLKYGENTIMCFHPILLLDVLCLWAALLSLRERVNVSLGRLCNTSGTMLVLFLLFSVLGWKSPREKKMTIFFFFCTNSHCTAFESQSTSSFGKVSLVRYRDNKKEKHWLLLQWSQTGARRSKKIHLLLDQPKWSYRSKGLFTEDCHLLQTKF